MKQRKHIICLLITVITAVVMTACGQSHTIAPDYSGEIQATNGEMNYTALLDCSAEEVALSFSSPESVAGLSYTFSGDELHTSLNGLDCITPADSLPKDSLPVTLHTVFADTGKAAYLRSENGVDTFTLNADDKTIVITAKDGVPQTLTSDKGNWKIRFS